MKTGANTGVRHPLTTEPVRESGFGVVVQGCRHLCVRELCFKGLKEMWGRGWRPVGAEDNFAFSN